MKHLVWLLAGCASSVQSLGPSVYVRPDVLNPQEGCPQTWPDEIRTELARAGYRIVYDANIPHELDVRVGGTWPKWGCNAQPSRLEVSKGGVDAGAVEADGTAALIEKFKTAQP